MAQRIEDVDILRMRAAGMDYGEISEALGVSRSTAHTHVQRAIEQARRDMAAIAQDRLALADARLEWMIEKVSRMIAVDCSASVFDDKKYKIVIGLLERQAKTLGYDRVKDANKGTDDWMTTASPEKLKEYAEELGLRVPSTFD
jgi:IS30 family transposase